MKNKTWNGTLNKRERAHLKEMKIRTKYDMEKQIKYIKEINERTPDYHTCWDCEIIAKKLNIW